MNVLVLGSGGREHAFVWKLKQSAKVSHIFTAPGNAGTARLGTNLAISNEDFGAVKKAVLQFQIGLVVVGPEAPLVKGIRDFFKADSDLKNIPIVGPDQRGAMLEGSKDLAKEFMQKYQVPTAKYFTVTAHNLNEGIQFLETLKAPYVLKADGLAAGKGVIITESLQEAKDTLKEMLGGKFGAASAKVVIEEFLKGIELSVFVLTDGISYKILPEAKDYKRIGVADTGLNTGGMGAISPVPFANAEFMQKVEERIVKPTIEGLHQENFDYVGFVFIGIMKVENDPYVIEYNVRMGDPETEVVLPRINSDLFELLLAAGQKRLSETELTIAPGTAATVMLVSGGYPEDYEKGFEITGLKDVSDCTVFHAGTKLLNDKVVTDGGRVLAVTGMGKNMNEALKHAYINAEKIEFTKMYFRADIGADLSRI